MAGRSRPGRQLIVMRGRRGVTLMELLVAVAILGVVLIAASSLYVSGARMQRDTHDQSLLQLEANLALDHVARRFPMAVGIVRPAPSGTSDRLEIRVDGGDPSVDTDDREWHYFVENNVLWVQQVGGDPQALAESVQTFRVVRDPDNTGGQSTVEINMTLGSPATGRTFSVDTRVTSRSMRTSW